MYRIAKWIGASAIAVSLIACGQPILTPAVTKVVVPVDTPSPTPIVCTENPAGLVLDVHTLESHGIRVICQGFEPGEQLLLVFTAETETTEGRRSTRTELRPGQSVEANGTFFIEGTLLPLSRNGDMMYHMWHLAVVHRRGVACITFRVP